MPVDMIAGAYREIKPNLKKHAVVTDMGSVKKAVVDGIQRFDGCESFIGSHPMVGSERTGVKNMRPFLYAGGTCVITPRPGKEKNRLIVEAFWRALGMKTVTMTPQAHDAAVSLISHFPHLNGFALIKTAEPVIRSKKGVIGPGFRDATRIAASSGEIWSAITLLNKKEVVKNIRAFTGELKKLEGYIIKNDRASLMKYMNRAAGLRKTM
ncbi:MAG TPA: prephenate dehydrogenase/arogenate dehydrogenase family protein [bacterium]|nr:prephenate dehydrogenase/arogenate dehydrogenase family protein [bacterium]